jgi:hypothetical protein
MTDQSNNSTPITPATQSTQSTQSTQPAAPTVDFSFSSALEKFKEQGRAEVGVMQRQPLQYLKAGNVHKLRIVPGVKNPIEWFISIKRHYFGSATIAPLRRSGGRLSCICSEYANNQPCFSESIRSYLEASGSSISSEFVPRDAALVNAYRANEADPQLFPFLMTKTNIGQLVDLWKEGYVFFHPDQGFAVTFKPVEGMSLFTITPDAMKQSPLPAGIMDSAKPLDEVVESLLIPYDTLKSWFTDPLVRAVDHFIDTGEALPLNLNLQQQQQQQQQQFNPAPSQPAPTEELSFAPDNIDTPTQVEMQPSAGEGFLDQLKNKMNKLQGQQ